MRSEGGGTVTGIRRPEAPEPRGPSTTGFIILALSFMGLLVLLAVIIPMSGVSRQVVCDAVVERWMIPEDYAGSGCVMLPPWWEYLESGHDTERVCLSMCPQDITPRHS
jgi:hypothetical protein